MAVPDDSAIGQTLAAEGYFTKAAQGDQRAASLFARLAAFRLNPSGNPSGWGALRKGGGTQVDGYAEDAIVFGSNPADVMNVADTVVGAGAAGASLPSRWDAKPRRTSDTWERPRALTDAELAYLRGGAAPGPTPGPTPVPPSSGLKERGNFAQDITTVNFFYSASGGLQRVGGMVDGVDASVFEVLRKVASGELTDLTSIQNAARAVLNVRCDLQSMIQWCHDLAKSGSKVDDTIKAIRQSDEWRSKHPGETP